MKNQKKSYVRIGKEICEVSSGGMMARSEKHLYFIHKDDIGKEYAEINGEAVYLAPYHPKAGKPKKDKEEKKVKVNLSLPEYKYKKLIELYPKKLNAMLEVWADDMIYNGGHEDGK